MPDWTALLVDAAGRQPGTWDILDAGGAPATLCSEYETAEVAYATLRTAGFGPIREGITPPALDADHDPRSQFRFGRPGAAIIMVRRRPTEA